MSSFQLVDRDVFRDRGRRVFRGVAAACALVGCAESPLQPELDPNAHPLEIDAKVNVQMGHTPVGQRPLYIVTGSVSALEDGIRREARVDSVVIEFNRNSEPWARLPRQSAVPFGDGFR